ncbi:MAG: hypothetical protein U0637_03970 [Phycisphaerales bacterium]
MPRRGITLWEVLIALAVCVTAAVLFAVLANRAQSDRHRLRDSFQVRSIHQGLILGAQSGRDSFITPSWYDKANTTINAEPSSKNTTANILSIHIYNGYFIPDMLISPAEKNPRIRACTNYSQSAPPTAATPNQALWDPAFSADFIHGIGNTSYAHEIPAGRSGGLSPRWCNDFQASEAVIANRGPLVASTDRNDHRLSHAAFNTGSNTLRFYGRSPAWQGNVAYNDNHAVFEKTFMPLTLDKNGRPDPQAWDDILFYDEYLPADGPDHPYAINNYLGIFTKAGPTVADFTAIWD